MGGRELGDSMKFLFGQETTKHAVALFKYFSDLELPVFMVASKDSVTFNAPHYSMFLKLTCPVLKVIKAGQVAVPIFFMGNLEAFKDSHKLLCVKRRDMVMLEDWATDSVLGSPLVNRHKLFWVRPSPLVRSITMDFSQLRKLLDSSSFSVGSGEVAVRFSGNIIFECDYDSIRAIGEGATMMSSYRMAVEPGPPVRFLLPKRIIDPLHWYRGDTATISIFEKSIVVSVKSDVVLSIGVKRTETHEPTGWNFPFKEKVSVVASKRDFLVALWNCFISDSRVVLIMARPHSGLSFGTRFRVSTVDGEFETRADIPKARVTGGPLSIMVNIALLFAAVYHAKGEVKIGIDPGNKTIVVTGEDENYIGKLHTC